VRGRSKKGLMARLAMLLRARGEDLARWLSDDRWRLLLSMDPWEINRLSLARAHRVWTNRSWALLAAVGHRVAEGGGIAMMRQMLASARIPHYNLGFYLKEKGHSAFWAFGIRRHLVLRMAERFGLTAAVYCGPETGGNIEILDAAGRVLATCGQFDPDWIRRELMRLHGRSCHFRCGPQGFFEAMLKSAFLGKYHQVQL